MSKIVRILSFVSALVVFSAAPGAAEPIVVNVEGVINAVFDNTGALNGSGIVNGSTFTATFTYDTDTAALFSFSGPSGDAATYATNPWSLVVDSVHTFQIQTPTNLHVRNDDLNFHDRLDLGVNGNTVFPFAYNPNDNLFRLTWEDTTETILSDASLPGADFFNLPLSAFSRKELFIRTDLDRNAGKLWIISGHVTAVSAQAQQVPEPMTASLLAVGAAFAAWRRCWGSHAN